MSQRRQPKGPLRLLLVDDSASVRAVLRRFFSWTSDIEVVGEAVDGETAVSQVLNLAPDVVLMDLMMPGLDGYRATEKIMALRPTPIIVLSSRVNRNQMRIAFEAMRCGAIEVLGKPEDMASWNQLADTLPEMVRIAAGARPRAARGGGGEVEPELATRRLRWVAIGASTGGPAALRELIAALPVPIPFSLLVVQHITAGFEAGLADWLHREFAAEVKLAREGEVPPLGAVRLAPAGAHLRLAPGGVLHLDAENPARGGHRPSVDELFLSVATSSPGNAAGVLLTGMGVDGAEGLLALRQAGGLTLVQDAASSVVFGMPRAALERGAAELALPPGEIGRYLGRVALPPAPPGPPPPVRKPR